MATSVRTSVVRPFFRLQFVHRSPDIIIQREWTPSFPSLPSSPRAPREELKAVRKINLGRNDAVEHSVNWLGKKTRGEVMGQRSSNAKLTATFTLSPISYHCTKCTYACHGRHSDLDAAFGAVNRFDLCYQRKKCTIKRATQAHWCMSHGCKFNSGCKFKILRVKKVPNDWLLVWNAWM